MCTCEGIIGIGYYRKVTEYLGSSEGWECYSRAWLGGGGYHFH